MNSKWTIGLFLSVELLLPWHAISSTPPVIAQQPPRAVTEPAVSLPPNSWRGLVPLHSSRVDVERLLGKPKSSHGFTSVYETEREAVDVLYSAGPCKLSAIERWNVTLDTVLRMDVRPRAKILVQALHLDERKYPRLQEAHPDNWARYMNDEEGVMVETISYGKEEEVYTITYWPRLADKALRCNQRSARAQPDPDGSIFDRSKENRRA